MYEYRLVLAGLCLCAVVFPLPACGAPSQRLLGNMTAQDNHDSSKSWQDSRSGFGPLLLPRSPDPDTGLLRVHGIFRLHTSALHYGVLVLCLLRGGTDTVE